MVSSNFLFVVFSFNVLFLLNFLLPHTEALWISWTLSKTHFWNLKLLVKLLFLLIFLFFSVHFVLLNYKFSRSLLQSAHQTSYILILHFLFSYFVSFHIILLFTTIFIIFSLYYKQHHLLFQIFLFCNFAYSCCLSLHFIKKTSFVFILTWFPLYTAFIILFW